MRDFARNIRTTCLCNTSFWFISLYKQTCISSLCLCFKASSYILKMCLGEAKCINKTQFSDGWLPSELNSLDKQLEQNGTTLWKSTKLTLLLWFPPQSQWLGAINNYRKKPAKHCMKYVGSMLKQSYIILFFLNQSHLKSRKMMTNTTWKCLIHSKLRT